ncbi:MAG: D-alanyl-D-alanine carboxypeptidase family protein [Gallionella sp.]
MPQLGFKMIAGCVLMLYWAAAHAASLPFRVEAASYLVQVNDETRWESEVGRRLPPASLTKVMTVLLVLEHYQPLEVVTVSLAAARESGTRLGLKAGERMLVQDLLAASLLKSANDACHSLADHVAGNEKQFVQLMNRRARELDLKSTHFTNACGHDGEQHYSSARDLAILAGRALAFPVFVEMVAKPAMTIRSADGSHSFVLENKNALIGRYPGAVGVKSGYTLKAGKCLIALAQRDGVKVLLVMLHASNRWWDASDILDYAFSHNARQVS